MSIESINSAMTPLQFARARATVRTVETNAALTSGSGNARSLPSAVSSAAASVIIPTHRLLPPATFHWSYRLATINGKAVAKRTPQLADTSYWSVALNRLG
jgi:hypothetical protein